MHAAMLSGQRLHLQHGPIDLVISADASREGGRSLAYQAAIGRFQGMLQELVDELPLLRQAVGHGTPVPAGSTATRMHRAVLPHASDEFVTPMAAVAGSVADEVLAAMTSAEPLRRAYVNNGGDIALHLDPREEFTVAISAPGGSLCGRISVNGTSGIGGIATSGRGGRSHSLGIADAVTVVGARAAEADAAATLIANCVDLPDNRAISRRPANQLDPDSDLRDLPVVVDVGHLDHADILAALAGGAVSAARMHAGGLIGSVALMLRGTWKVIGDDSHFFISDDRKKSNG